KAWMKGNSCISNPFTTKFRSKEGFQLELSNDQNIYIFNNKLTDFFKNLGFQVEDADLNLDMDKYGEILFKILILLENDIPKTLLVSNKFLYTDYILTYFLNKHEFDDDTAFVLLEIAKIIISNSGDIIKLTQAIYMKKISNLLKKFHSKPQLLTWVISLAVSLIKISVNELNNEVLNKFSLTVIKFITNKDALVREKIINLIMKTINISLVVMPVDFSSFICKELKRNTDIQISSSIISSLCLYNKNCSDKEIFIKIILNQLMISDYNHQNVLIQSLANNSYNLNVFKPYFPTLLPEFLSLDLTNAEPIFVMSCLKLTQLFTKFRIESCDVENISKYVIILCNLLTHPNTDFSLLTYYSIDKIILKFIEIINVTNFLSHFTLCFIQQDGSINAEDEWVLDILINVRNAYQVSDLVRILELSKLIYSHLTKLHQHGNDKLSQIFTNIFHKLISILINYNFSLTNGINEFIFIQKELKFFFENDPLTRIYIVKFISNVPIGTNQHIYEIIDWIPLLFNYYVVQSRKNANTIIIKNAIEKIFSNCHHSVIEDYYDQLQNQRLNSTESQNNSYKELMLSCYSFLSFDFMSNLLDEILVISVDKKLQKKSLSNLHHWISSFNSRICNCCSDQCFANNLFIIKKIRSHLDKFISNFDSTFSAVVLNCFIHLIPSIPNDELYQILKYSCFSLFNSTSKVVKRSQTVFNIILNRMKNEWNTLSSFLTNIKPLMEDSQLCYGAFQLVNFGIKIWGNLPINEIDVKYLLDLILPLLSISYRQNIMNSILHNNKFVKVHLIKSKILSILQEFLKSSTENEIKFIDNNCEDQHHKLFKNWCKLLKNSKKQKNVLTVGSVDELEYDFDEKHDPNSSHYPLGISKIRRGISDIDIFKSDKDGKLIFINEENSKPVIHHLKKSDSLNDSSSDTEDTPKTSRFQNRTINQKPKKTSVIKKLKNKFEPYAYIPLNRKLLKNKNSKLSEQFKGIVKSKKRQ
ncbi:hypothetical protein MXB_1580, partial [Myxobolus squamalis]